MTLRVDLLVFSCLLLLPVGALGTNFTQCLLEFKNGTDPTGGTDFFGKPVSNVQDALGLTYETCKSMCGTGQETFSWSDFSQQFSAWLLPWLALVSQLPFGAESRLDNLISVVLTVGSPTLAAFSLALTALNTRWVNNRFAAFHYPNHKKAARALIYLQQVPLRLTTRDGLLASLIILPENDEWWETLVDRLEQTFTWTIATATSIAWVLIAFVFTIVDSLMSLGDNLNSNGQGVGTLWLWLVPVVVGWLWIPVCCYDKLKTAIDRANDIAYVAAVDKLPQVGEPPKADPPRRADDVHHMQGFEICRRRDVFTQDACRAAPVFNYARFLDWYMAAETIARAFESADERAKKHIPVNCRPENWVFSEDKKVPIARNNRIGTVGQVQAYCRLPAAGFEEHVQPVPSGVWKRIFVASVFALGLQWATTGSAAIIVIYTPTTGLGCRSGSYILYGIFSTIIWLTLMLSSYFAHCAKVRYDIGASHTGFNSANSAKLLATILRRFATFAAACNTLCIILACVFQFSDFFSTCYCNSSVLGRGAQYAFNIIAPGYNYDQTRAAWIGGVVLAGGYVFIFLFALHLMLEPSHDTINK